MPAFSLFENSLISLNQKDTDFLFNQTKIQLTNMIKKFKKVLSQHLGSGGRRIRSSTSSSATYGVQGQPGLHDMHSHGSISKDV